MIRGAYIYSDKHYDYTMKICGLYILERLLYTLHKTGIQHIVLHLDSDEKAFFNKTIVPYITKKGIIVEEWPNNKKPEEGSMVIPSNVFIQPHYFDNFKKYFKESKKIYEPLLQEDQFLINSINDVKKAESLIVKYIIENTGGYIAKNINKRISIPISLQLAKTRIHPNILTVINMLVGIVSAFFITQATYWNMVIGGLLFQLASIFDGVDGEVAKFTFTVSKIGGWLDTIGDNGTLLLFLIAVSWLYFKNTSIGVACLVVSLCFMGLFWFIGMMVWYLRKYSESGSLVAYDKEFLQKLPREDIFVKFALSMKYITKKEFFALFFFCFSFTGKIFLLIPIITFVVCAGACVLTIINIKYLKAVNTIR